MAMIFKTESYTEIEKTLCEYFDISKSVLEKTALSIKVCKFFKKI